MCHRLENMIAEMFPQQLAARQAQATLEEQGSAGYAAHPAMEPRGGGGSGARHLAHYLELED